MPAVKRIPASACPATRARISERSLEDPDVRLMLRVRDGDAAAFAELIGSYSTRVFGYLYRQIGDRAEAEDLTQEVFMRLYRARERYQPTARFGTWVFHVTQNVARNALRSRRRRPWVPLDGTFGEQGQPLDRSEAPSRPMERCELADAVRTAVAGLGSRQRAAVELHQFHDCTYAEVAAELDMTPKAAKSLLYCARNQLRESLTGLSLS